MSSYRIFKRNKFLETSTSFLIVSFFSDSQTRFINFKKFLEYKMAALHGIRIHLKGRFKGIKRSRSNKYVEGTVPFNTIRANIDYCVEKSITVNGSFGLHLWLTYKNSII